MADFFLRKGGNMVIDIEAWNFDSICEIVAEVSGFGVRIVDDSFSHEFGIEHIEHIEIENDDILDDILIRVDFSDEIEVEIMEIAILETIQSRLFQFSLPYSEESVELKMDFTLIGCVEGRFLLLKPSVS